MASASMSMKRMAAQVVRRCTRVNRLLLGRAATDTQMWSSDTLLRYLHDKVTDILPGADPEIYASGGITDRRGGDKYVAENGREQICIPTKIHTPSFRP